MCASADIPEIVSCRVGGQILRARHRPGTGRPVLICSDFAVNIEVLDDFCAAMSRPTIVFDWPGVGAPGVSRFQRMPALAALLVGLLDALGVAAVDVLGMGWGGLLAQQFARDHAHRLGRLVLVATSTGAIMLPGRLANLRRLARTSGLRDIARDGSAARALFGGRRDTECRAVAGALHRARAPALSAVAAQVYALAGFSSLTWAHRISAPTLILAGDDDRLMPLANARVLQMLIPHAELSVLCAAGHWLLIERQFEAIRRIEAFLAGDDARTRR
ncbi:alpha/beta fold hydrolase [Salinisphaera sp. Q1T1-3]|uniref:alpha/beta fold hydrolase n=1 Tax=Salinisphaera sp. Q1T1-3 TaxID=2321229 RepID=UPI00131465AD|nr:alpha/beta fold hydrolase [Salinisphaera sp. Q1T1-3]